MSWFWNIGVWRQRKKVEQTSNVWWQQSVAQKLGLFYFPWVYLLDQNILGNSIVMPNTGLSEPAAIIYDFLLVRELALTLPHFNPTDRLWRIRNSPSVFPQQKIRKIITYLNEKSKPLPVQIFLQARDFWERNNPPDIFPETLTSLSLRKSLNCWITSFCGVSV